MSTIIDWTYGATEQRSRYYESAVVTWSLARAIFGQFVDSRSIVVIPAEFRGAMITTEARGVDVPPTQALRIDRDRMDIGIPRRRDDRGSD